MNVGSGVAMTFGGFVETINVGSGVAMTLGEFVGFGVSSLVVGMSVMTSIGGAVGKKSTMIGAGVGEGVSSLMAGQKSGIAETTESLYCGCMRVVSIRFY